MRVFCKTACTVASNSVNLLTISEHSKKMDTVKCPGQFINLLAEPMYLAYIYNMAHTQIIFLVTIIISL